MARNLSTSLARRRRAQPMQAYDRLPDELRHWLHRAALPWSAASVLRLWRRALAEAKGDRSLAQARLDRAEARLLARDAARIWGPGHPAAEPARSGRGSAGAGAGPGRG
jgi:hypothetical protein